MMSVLLRVTKCFYFGSEVPYALEAEHMCLSSAFVSHESLVLVCGWFPGSVCCLAVKSGVPH